MPKDTKLGTFGGVFTPSVLTILGVIMYLRLPWVMGHAGLVLGLGIIAAAHVVSVTTGLSISSIATDKKVGAGGPYFIVSRSLGLPIGGTVGVALFVGFSLSIAFYAIGFAESFLTYWRLGLDPSTGLPTANALRICGTATLVALTVVTFISTSLAIKAQYLILALIALSLVSIFLGQPGHAAAPIVPSGPPPTVPTGVLFAVFFPAVTGFTAGVNMSGDLRDPNRAIPRGTMLAIGTGLVVYVAMALFLIGQVPREQLLYNPAVLVDIALSPQLVVAGIWGATLSSALGSILGAPRILQALAVDKIGPRFFAKGQGKAKEPRRALLLAFAIGQGGILLAELDAIAGIVSMVFLATYGFLNTCCAIEAWASPDFRPSFRIPTWVSVVGAVAALVIMIQIDLPSMVGAAAVMALLFFVLQRRQLVLDSGDAWEGIWASLVRSGLQRLTKGTRHQRNWRPVIALFERGDGVDHEPGVRPPASRAFTLATSLVRGRGLLTRFMLVAESEAEQHEAEAAPTDELPAGVFEQQLASDDPWAAITGACQHHGYAGLAPNTVLLALGDHQDEPEALSELLDRLQRRDLNVLLSHAPAEPATQPPERIDAWWAADRGNVAFTIALLRFLTGNHEWREVDVRLLLFDDGGIQADVAQAAANAMLRDARLTATVQIVRGGLHAGTFTDAVLEESADADLTLVGLASDWGDSPRTSLAQQQALVGGLRHTLLLRAASEFEDIAGAARAPDAATATPSRATAAKALPSLRLPRAGELARQVSSFDQQHLRIIRQFTEDGLSAIWQPTVQLLDGLAKVTGRQLGQLERALAAAEGPRRSKSLARIERTVLFQCQRLLRESLDSGLETQQRVLENRIEEYLKACAAVALGVPDELTVHRPARDFAPAVDDTRYAARVKRAARLRVRLLGEPVAQRLPAQPMVAHALDQGAELLYQDGIVRLRTASHGTVIALARLLRSLRSLLEDARRGSADDPTSAERVRQEREGLLAELEALREHALGHLAEQRELLERRSRELAQTLAQELDRLDVRRLARRRRRSAKQGRGPALALRAEPHSWRRQHHLLLEQAEVGLMMAGFQHRIRAIVERIERALLPQIERGLLKQVDELAAALEQLRTGAESAEPVAALDTPQLTESLDQRRIVDDLVEDTQRALVELPEFVSGVPDEALSHLEDGRIDESAVVEIPLRRLVQFLLESQLIGGLQEAIARVPAVERRSIAVAEEVVRLCQFHLGDAGHQDDVDDEARDENLRSVLEDGLLRLSAERNNLLPLAEQLAAEVSGHLTSFLQATEQRSLLGSLDQVGQRMRSHEGRKALAGLRRVEGQAALGLGRLAVRLLYRTSAGVLAARALRSAERAPRSELGSLAGFVAGLSPDPTVLQQLPYYYQQLFLGQTAINESFWVGRERQLEQAALAVQRYRQGVRGTLVVTGDLGEGKTALCGVIANRLFDPTRAFRVLPPRAGAVVSASLQASLQRATRLQGGCDAILRSLPEDSLVVLDDLELWWEHRPDGLEVLEEIQQLVERHADRCFFLLSGNSHAFALVDRLLGLSARALAVLECTPLDAEALLEVVMLRHRSAGRTFVLGDRREEDLTDWRLARLFNAYFDHSRGNLGAALPAWVAHVDEVHDRELQIREPVAPNLEPLQQLDDGRLALLLELALHRRLDWAALERVVGGQRRALRRSADPLVRAGLVQENRHGVLELNRYARHLVVECLRQRGWLV